MHRFRGVCAGVTVAVVVVLSITTRADAGNGCPFTIVVNRQGGRELTARVCRLGAVVNWLGVTPEAEVTSQAPNVDLLDGFTITIFLTHPPRSAVLRPILTERVYPLALGGPVAFVPSRTVLHEETAYPRWVVPAGWRTLDASRPLPPVLQRLGMSQPVGHQSSSSNSGAPSAATASQPGPDVVSLAALLAILATAAVLVRRFLRIRHP